MEHPKPPKHDSWPREKEGRVGVACPGACRILDVLSPLPAPPTQGAGDRVVLVRGCR